MPDHDEADTSDDSADGMSEPSGSGQIPDKSDESDRLEVPEFEAGAHEQDPGHLLTRWRRIKDHPAFRPVLVAGGLVAVGGIMLALRSPEGVKQVSAKVLEDIPEVARAAAFRTIGEEASRMSPVEHIVNGYERLQHYGPGRAETKIVKVSAYLRGGAA